MALTPVVAVGIDAVDCAVNGKCSLPVTDYRFALPIPTAESNPNGAILATQNPGY